MDDSEHVPKTGRESLMSRSSRRAGEWRAGSTRLAWWSGERAMVGVVGRRRDDHDGLL